MGRSFSHADRSSRLGGEASPMLMEVLDYGEKLLPC
uniref:Uncharacterized protein n=1 Tax=Parascaris univalens TaxID=6257 RepID=A0A915BIY0_PARUN